MNLNQSKPLNVVAVLFHNLYNFLICLINKKNFYVCIYNNGF